MSRSCLITGGASGIGEACARLFVQRDYRVAIADIDAQRGRAIAAEIGNAAFYSLDVQDEEQFQSVVDEVVAESGALNCLINNAAIAGVRGPISEIPVDEFDLTTRIIFRSVFLGTKHAARVMQSRRAGSIVNVASIAGLTGGMGPHVYSACKAAVIHFTKSVALELAENHVRVNAVCPGNVETRIHTGVLDESWQERMPRVRELLADEQAMGRMAKPIEIAEAVHWLASDAASFVTGHAMIVDGGLMAGKSWRRQPAYLGQYAPAISLRSGK